LGCGRGWVPGKAAIMIPTAITANAAIRIRNGKVLREKRGVSGVVRCRTEREPRDVRRRTSASIYASGRVHGRTVCGATSPLCFTLAN
jgi:hypothetical protein